MPSAESCIIAGLAVSYPLLEPVIHTSTQSKACIVAGVHEAEVAGRLSIPKLRQPHLPDLPLLPALKA